jgi:SAM-dependent methyltransferase
MRHCPCCQGDNLFSILHRQAVPVHQNLLMPDRHAALDVMRGELDMQACRRYGFVFNATFDPSLLQYGESYDNRQTCSDTFMHHVDALVHHLLEQRNVNHCRIVEVGCGQGDFVERLVREGTGNSGFGFDPSYRGSDSRLGGKLHFYRSYYGPDAAHIKADVVVCRHVIEHVPEPLVLLQAVREALKDSGQARIYFETPCVDWILENSVVWDFFYEHCSLFSASSLRNAFETAGFVVDEVRHVFEGQYLWIEARVAEDLNDALPSPGRTLSLGKAYAAHEPALIGKWQQVIEAAATNGKVGLWGAGAKGSTFANLIDPDCYLLDCVVDLNPNKQGKYIAGTGHPIVDCRELGERGVSSVILMNPNYRDENLVLLRQAKLNIELIDPEGAV